MFTYIFKNRCDINDLLDVKLKRKEKGFYSEHIHYKDIVVVYAWSKKQAMKKIERVTKVEPKYVLYRLDTPLRHHLRNLFGGLFISDTQWLTDF